MKNVLQTKALFVLFAIVLLTPVSVARASAFDDMAHGIGIFLGAVRDGVLRPIQNSYCGWYDSEVASGAWGAGDFRKTVGDHICAGFTPDQNESPSFAAGTSTLALPGFTGLNLSGFNFQFPQVNVSPSALPGVSESSNTVATGTVSLPGSTVTSDNASGGALDPSSILYWTNIQRHDNGSLAALSDNATLDTIAQIRVKDMFAKQYFDHYSPSGDNVSKEAAANGYQYITIGENIALGNFASARALVQAWMDSPGHRANILNGTYTEIGIYAEEGQYQGSDVWIASQVFGKPLGDCPEPSAADKTAIANEQAQANSLAAQLSTIKNQMAADSSDTAAYNADAAKYNSIANQYNALIADIKNRAAVYNTAVNAFNACIKS